MDLREIGWGVVEWMHLAQERVQYWALVNTIMNLLFSLKGVEFLE
jgi:hypothetical protein